MKTLTFFAPEFRPAVLCFAFALTCSVADIGYQFATGNCAPAFQQLELCKRA